MMAPLSSAHLIMSLLKKFLISIVTGLIGYEITKMTLGGGFTVPTTTPEISLLLIFIATAFFTIVASAAVDAVPSNNSAPTRAAPRQGKKPAESSSRNKSSSSTSSGSSRASTGGGPREEGTVKWFNVRKGYGFITRDQGEDVFVHFRNIEGTGRKAIAEGQRVSFVVTSGDKGPQADQVESA